MLVERDRPAIAASFHGFHPGNCLGLQKFQDPVPIVRWTEVEPENILIFGFAGAFCEPADLRWGPVIDLVNGGVETANGTETGRERDLGHRQGRLIDELFGKMQAARLRNGVGCGAKMTQKQAPKMARSDAKMFR